MNTGKLANKSAHLSPADFVHLHNHTHYSVLDGLQKIPAMLNKVKELGMDAVAVTDHGTLSGAIELFDTAKTVGVKPIIGIETYVANRTHLDKDVDQDKQRFHLILLAMNQKGYKNLLRLSTIANLDGFYYKPRIDRDLLEKYNDGLICLSGCISSEIGEALKVGATAKAEKIASWYKQLFGDRYYLEVADHGYKWPEQAEVNKAILELGKKLDIPVVVTTDAHYLEASDQDAHEVLLCVQTGSFLSDEDRMSLKNLDLYLKEPQEIIDRWSDYPDVITNTKAIADRCDVTIELGNIMLPKFPLSKGEEEQVYLRKLVYRGLVWRYEEVDREKVSNLTIANAKKKLPSRVIERAEFELKTIISMKFASYFLIVQDFINWGKHKGIVFGPGRGSAAGSIVSYALNITDLDPLEYDLLFERFLNPDRISLPDIDIDIQDNRRDEVIEYCVSKYGQERVAHIVTFGKMAARNAIRDVSRVLEVPYSEADRLAKLVPPPVQGRHTPLSQSIQIVPALANEYSTSDVARRVFDLAVKLDGTIRSHGVHAAGVVIAPDDIVEFTPLEMAQKGVVTTQYSMYPIEELGLLKMDFLGLSNLTTIKNALRIIRKVWKNDINIGLIPLNDKKVFDLLGKGETTGVFQFESSGMKRYLKLLKPTVFEDIIAQGALYRPGPLTAGLTDKFIARKNGLELVVYEHPLMEPALKSTYGVLVYQEQVMRIARDMCGFTGGQADTLRKAIGKKNIALMDKMKIDFVEGMVKHSAVSKEFAQKFWHDLEGFADYAFNKSHSASYGLISYQTAYLKAHYPSAFMAALMTTDYSEIERLAIDISECKHLGIAVLIPDINESFVEFGVVAKTKQIRFGLSAIKNVGSSAAEEIVETRGSKPYVSITDFISRVKPSVINRKTMESLIKAGAFDGFGSRSLMLHNLDKILAYSTQKGKQALSNQIDLFGSDSLLPQSDDLVLDLTHDEVPEREVLKWERELLGIYLSKHPLEGYEVFFEENTVSASQINEKMDGRRFYVGGVIQSIKEVTTKTGAKMAFLTVEDLTGEIELIVFPSTYTENRDIWQLDKVILAYGKITSKDRSGAVGEIKMLVEEARELTTEEIDKYKATGNKKTTKSVKKQKSKPTNKKDDPKLYLLIANPEDDLLLQKLKQVLSKHSGPTSTVLVLGESKTKAIKLPFGVSVNKDLRSELKKLLGAKSVAIK